MLIFSGLMASLLIPSTALAEEMVPPLETVTTQEAITQNASLQVEIDQIVYGGDEPIHIKGVIHQNYQITENANKSLVVLHSNAHGIRGTGLNSGEPYVGAGSTICIINDNQFSYETTYVDNFLLIGKGKLSDYKLHYNYHLTQNANGVWTAQVDHLNIIKK
ncbi:hypothetical protein [Paenibacillus silviterrae]|uniref:hypothetical protein n=1 Tax=Paenibacillus silviterrae TaxID=3242194 RepID=UPI00254324D7|nr:hypothetical protein [Paenibacillus chinjuensis]